MSGPDMSGPDEAERLARAGLTSAGEPGHAPLAQLIAAVGPVAAWEALHAPDERLRNGPLAGVANRAAAADPARDLERAARAGARLVCPGEAEWPVVALRPLELAALAPVALWVRGAGRLDLLTERAVAVVGTRAPSEYGLYVAGELGAGLADSGYTVVSGGAYGIDAAAHRGALVSGGSTIAVLACGVDVDYPKAHRNLFARIAESGVVLSEQPPGAAPYRSRFLQRNRLIAALGLGVVVVEAGLRSGARSTAAHAGRLGRPVMAVPGPVTAVTSAGCNRLIASLRASLVTGIADVLEVVGRLGEDLAPEPEISEIEDSLPMSAKQVLDALPLRRAAVPEAIALAAGVAPAEVLGCLGLLGGLGLAEQVGAGWRVAGQHRPSRNRADQLLRRA